MLPLDKPLKELYALGRDDEQQFIQNLALFLSTILKEHAIVLEGKHDAREFLLNVSFQFAYFSPFYFFLFLSTFLDHVFLISPFPSRFLGFRPLTLFPSFFISAWDPHLSIPFAFNHPLHTSSFSYISPRSHVLPRAALQGVQYLLLISEVEETEIFKICLEYWLNLSCSLYQENPMLALSGGPMKPNHDVLTPRRQTYNAALSKVLHILELVVFLFFEKYILKLGG